MEATSTIENFSYEDNVIKQGGCRCVSLLVITLVVSIVSIGFLFESLPIKIAFGAFSALIVAICMAKLMWALSTVTKQLALISSIPANNPNPLINVSVTGDILFANAAADRVFPTLNEDRFHPVVSDIHKEVGKCHSNKPFVRRQVAFGEKVYMQYIVPVFEDEARTVVRYIMLYQHDMTDQKQVESYLKVALEEAEKTTAVKSEFLANMSHELRTPMNGIMGMCHLLLDSSLEEEQRESAEAIYKSSENLLVLLNDILDISKVESGDLRLESVPFDIPQMMDELMKLFSPVADEGGLDLRLEYDQSDYNLVMGDPARLQQILRNLLSNALKFTEEGEVVVKVSMTEVENKMQKLYFSVKDSGIGIPEDKLLAIFEKFTQADSTTTRKFGGTGLGLAITEHLVKMMGGQIGVESTLGEGSVFYFFVPLPLAKEGAQPVNIAQDGHETVDEIRSDGLDSAMKILLVDDHPINVLFMQKILKKMSFENIDVAENGVQAVDRIAEKDYDIVLMDCQMPEMDGFQATRVVRELEQGTDQRLPIIALTANAMVGDREKCLKAGMDDYLSKPVKVEELSKAMVRHVMHEKNTDGLENQSETLPPIGDITSDNVNSNDQDDAMLKKQAGSKAPVDIAHLDLFTGGDAEEEKMIMDIFFTEAEKSMTILRENIQSPEFEIWQKAAHKMKGAAGNFGAAILQELCKEAELGADKDEDFKKGQIFLIEAELVHVKRFMENRFKR